MTPTQLRVLRVLANGGEVRAAVNYPEEILRGGPELSERVPIRVAIAGRILFCIRNKTAYPLWRDGLMDHAEGVSGDRDFTITPAGRRALGKARSAADGETPRQEGK